MIKSEAKPVKATKGDKATTTFKLNTPGTCNKQKKAFKYLLDYYLALVRAKRAGHAKARRFVTRSRVIS